MSEHDANKRKTSQSYRRSFDERLSSYAVLDGIFKSKLELELTMNIETYLNLKEQRRLEEPKFRILCHQCRQPDFSCYCSSLRPIDCPIHFIILIHPIEVRRRIATGRMSHQCLKGSHLIRGKNFSENSEVNRLVNDLDYESAILFPGNNSLNLSSLNREERLEEFKGKKLRIFVIDGTWGTAKSMVNQSENLKDLPRICFVPEKPSNFRVRKQPRENCYSTIEAIHHTLELLGEAQGLDMAHRPHDQLIQAFDNMINKQVSYISTSKRRYRSRKNKKRQP